jgi:hypothetical protein
MKNFITHTQKRKTPINKDRKVDFFSLRINHESDIKLVSLNNSFELLVLIRQFGWRLLNAAHFGKSVKYPTRLLQAYNFGKYLLRMKKHHGASSTVMYLKACQLALQKHIAKDKIKSLRDLNPNLPLPRLTQSGLPRFIPSGDRQMIYKRSVFVIR